MRRLLLLPILGAVLLLLPASPASAATCRGFDFERVEGSEVIYQAFGIRASRVDCRSARRHIRLYHSSSNNDTQLNCAEGGSCSFRGYRCTASNTSARSSHRCQRGNRIIRWKYRFVSGD